MTTIRQFTCDDLFRFNNVNLDPLTETSKTGFLEVEPQEPLMQGVSVGDYLLCQYAANKRKMQYVGEYGLPFYMQYMAHWPEYFQVAESPSGEIMGYIMGKAEGNGEQWHGHVTALTVAPEFRRLGLAAKLMSNLEEISEKKRCYFVDLFVRVSNKVAVDMYNKLGYSVYRRVIEYYSGDVDEDAYDMRKALSRDVEQKSIIPLAHPVRPEDLD